MVYREVVKLLLLEKSIVMQISERISFLAVLLGLAIVVCGNEACQEDIELAARSGKGTPTASPSPSPTDDDDDDTVTVTPTASPSPTPTSSPSTSTSLLGALSHLSVGGAVSPAIKTAPAAASKWPGGTYDDQEVKGVSLDSDGDGFTDELEVDAGSDPQQATSTPPSPVTRLAKRFADDRDLDGLSTSEESRIGTDPELSDSDGDGVADGAEVLSGANPLDGGSRPVDGDGDGLSNDYEANIGTNFASGDSDGDRVLDGIELALGSDPLNNDTDADGVLDWREVQGGSDPRIAEKAGNRTFSFE